MYSEIAEAFHLSENNVISEDYICSHPDPMGDISDLEPLQYMPSYMAWCVQNRDMDGNLICMYTINALAEFGRCKNPDLTYLAFKFRCSPEQKQAVIGFLNWSLANLPLENKEQIGRAIKQWSGS